MQRGMGRRAPAPALVEKQHIVKRWIEQPAMVGRATAARTAVEEHRRLGAWRADPLPIDLVAVTCIQQAAGIGLDRRVERPHRAQSPYCLPCRVLLAR